MLMPVQNISTVVTPVLQPILSNYQDDIKTQETYFTKVTKLLAVIGIPLSVFLFFTSRELILIVFGEQWIEAIMPFKILALSVAPQMLGSVLGSIYQSTNKVKAQLYIGLVNTTWSVSLMLFGLIYFKTTVGVAAMFSLALLVEMIYNWAFVYRYVYKKSVMNFLKLIAAPVVIALALGLMLYFMDLWTVNFNVIVSLLIKTLASLMVVGLLLQSMRVYDVKVLLAKAKNAIWQKRNS